MARETQSGTEDGNDVFDAAEAGTDLAGALAGSALGLIGGPAGALGGAALGVAVQRGGRAALVRLRGRERERAGAAVVLIAADTQGRRERGEAPRKDGFFDSQGGLRPEAEELLEGVLRQAAETWEERKLRHVAFLYGSVAHDATIAPATGVFLLRMTEGLTYRQMVALAACYDQERYTRLMLDFLEEGSVRLPRDLGPSVEETALVDAGLLGVRSKENMDVVHPSTLFGGTTNEPRVITPLGRLLASVLRLELVPDADLTGWAESKSQSR